MLVIAQYKVFQSRRGELVNGASILEPLPANANGGIHADQEEERPSQQGVDYFVVPYIGGDPSLSPPEGHEVEQGVDSGKGILRIDGARFGRGHMCVRRRLLHGRSGSGACKADALELVPVDQVRGDGRLARTDA